MNSHPYIPNTAPEVRKEMLKEIGAKGIDDLYADIPEFLRFRDKLNMPEALSSEKELRRHIEEIIAKNTSTDDALSFLGGGSASHYVPAICDEINQRSEFHTAYAGEPYEDHGRFQALFEYSSLMGELLEFDVVSIPTYDWMQAVCTSLRMVGRITGKNRLLISSAISPDRLSAIHNYCRSHHKIEIFQHCPKTGMVDLEELKERLGDDVAGVYFENPSYFGVIEENGEKIADLAHSFESLLVVGVDPLSLGVLNPPSRYGADIVCGDLQTLGIHPSMGGYHAGFISSRDEEKFVQEYPSRLFSILKTEKEGEWGFGDVLFERTSFAKREKGKEFVGTAAALWGITAGVYLSLMGPQGMRKVGELILCNARYARDQFAQIDGVSIGFASSHFKEFVLDFNETGKSLSRINQELLKKNIFGGFDLGTILPDCYGKALFCITECHSKEDIDKSAEILQTAIQKA